MVIIRIRERVDPCIVFGHGSKPNWTYGHRIERIRTLYRLWAWIKARVSVTHDLFFWMTVSIIRNQVCRIIIKRTQVFDSIGQTGCTYENVHNSLDKLRRTKSMSSVQLFFYPKSASRYVFLLLVTEISHFCSHGCFIGCF